MVWVSVLCHAKEISVLHSTEAGQKSLYCYPIEQNDGMLSELGILDKDSPAA